MTSRRLKSRGLIPEIPEKIKEEIEVCLESDKEKVKTYETYQFTTSSD